MRQQRQISVRTGPTIAIVVDGECEMWYIQMLKRNLRSTRIAIAPQIPQNKSIGDQFELVKTLSVDYTHVLWIIDLDVVLQQTKMAKKGEKTALQTMIECRTNAAVNLGNVVVIINNPCIEFWFLLHFEETTKSFDSCGKAEQQLRKHLKDYEKNERYFTKPGNDIFLRLRPHLGSAIVNAVKTGAFNAHEPYRGLTEMHMLFQCEPWTTFFELELRKVKKH